MASEIVINSNNREIRVALLENNQLAELFVEHKANRGIVGNVYLGKVVRVLPGMQVAFINIGLEKAGFLYVGDIDAKDFHVLGHGEQEEIPQGLNDEDLEDDQEKPYRRSKFDVPIQDMLKEGQELMVQIAKNPLGTKGPRLTSYITLPGRHIVYMPTMRQISVSRRIENEEEKERLKNLISEIGREGEGYIVRTAGEGSTKEDFDSDIEFLHRLWKNINGQSKKVVAPYLLYEDLNLIFRSIRDLFNQDVIELVIDSKPDYQKCLEFCSAYMPHLIEKIEFYDDRIPIFDHYGIEMEISRAIGQRIWLKSGGYISIDQTEALVAIDVNTGKFVGHSDPEETILKTNLEAVKEIVYQLRLRNVGGIIIVDFIDMTKESSKETVWSALNQALKSDRYRTRILKISEIGLVEMTRKRVRESISQTLCDPCSYCEGKGYIKSPTTICYEIFRNIQRMAGENLDKKKVTVQVHSSVYDLILEEENGFLDEWGTRFNLQIAIEIDPKLHQESYTVDFE